MTINISMNNGDLDAMDKRLHLHQLEITDLRVVSATPRSSIYTGEDLPPTSSCFFILQSRLLLLAFSEISKRHLRTTVPKEEGSSDVG